MGTQPLQVDLLHGGRRVSFSILAHIQILTHGSEPLLRPVEHVVLLVVALPRGR